MFISRGVQQRRLMRRTLSEIGKSSPSRCHERTPSFNQILPFTSSHNSHSILRRWQTRSAGHRRERICHTKSWTRPAVQRRISHVPLIYSTSPFRLSPPSRCLLLSSTASTQHRQALRLTHSPATLVMLPSGTANRKELTCRRIGIDTT